MFDLQRMFNMMNLLECTGKECTIKFYVDGSGEISLAGKPTIFVDVLDMEEKLKELGGLK